ncbi:hypothetical protein F444_11243 [Phytophthora nicotianae P1976]|uniref:Helicase ATP-binding domain-containing protein n=1 Tax=Phytophthora nicotianae P1976 TaxID=1317066 RepID=A0A081A1I2_PHYNI|nr:hypothetical protein F444_11243 [Phytophthora nicotianae P1976]
MAVETRVLALLVPVYPDMRSSSHHISPELQRTADDWLKLVFSTSDGIVEKEAACINRHDGCRLCMMEAKELAALSGQCTRNVRARVDNKADNALDTSLRSVPAENLASSGASLIVVRDPLVERWKYQIEAHVSQKALRSFIDETTEDLPSNFELAAYDVVVTSFSRLAKEWKLHRPASELEKRMPERYGFEDTQRYTDGTTRGEVSSLLTVHWVRVIVDEGHKLGGQTPTNLMRMARTLFAERRWVMTGTPTPNTLQSADLRFMHEPESAESTQLDGGRQQDIYAATRIRELKKEFARRASQRGTQSRRARYVKVIIFSHFTEMIRRTKLAFQQQDISTADFITRVSPKTRMRALERFRTDPR